MWLPRGRGSQTRKTGTQSSWQISKGLCKQRALQILRKSWTFVKRLHTASFPRYPQCACLMCFLLKITPRPLMHRSNLSWTCWRNSRKTPSKLMQVGHRKIITCLPRVISYVALYATMSWTSAQYGDGTPIRSMPPYCKIDRVQDSHEEQEFWMTRLDWV